MSAGETAPLAIGTPFQDDALVVGSAQECVLVGESLKW